MYIPGSEAALPETVTTPVVAPDGAAAVGVAETAREPQFSIQAL
jgi:hypothetical protein